MGAAVVEGLAVGSPGGEHFELGGAVLQVGHLSLLHVVGNEVALGVEHFDLVVVDGMEILSRLVGGIDDEVEPGMPGGIDTGREDGVVAHVHLFDLAVIGYDGTSVILTGMELHATGVVLLIVVAVDALAFFLEATEHVVVDDALVVVFQTALVDGQCLVADERGEDETVAEIAVDSVGRHVDAEGLVVGPLVSLSCIDVDGDGTALGLLRERAPVVDIGLRLAFTYYFLIAHGIAGNHPVGFLVELEGERGHVDRDGHVGIVGIDLRQVLALYTVFRYAGSTGEK